MKYKSIVIPAAVHFLLVFLFCPPAGFSGNIPINLSDSLKMQIYHLEKRISVNESLANSALKITQNLNERIDKTQANFRKKVIYLIIIICVVMLINLLLLLLLWNRMNRKIHLLSEDHDKTNEALNLHIKNASEEINALSEKISKTFP